MPPTIRDVAREAGVGLGTVSRVLNDSPHVSSATRRRVLDAIAALDYSPNPIARRLSLGKSMMIGVIAPFFTRPAFVERLRGIESALAPTQYDLAVYNVEHPERGSSLFRDLAQHMRIDGLIVISLPLDRSELEQLIKADVKTVLIDVPPPPSDEVSRVEIDDLNGGRRATEHLVDLGHTRIGFIGDPFDNPFGFVSSRKRFEGYRQALEQAGLRIEGMHREGTHGRFEAGRLAREMMNHDPTPTAVFASSDTQAIGIIEALRELGLAVPGDVSVIGFDNLEIAEPLGLTTMEQHLFESGTIGVRLLLEHISNPEREPEVRTMTPELVVRNTTASPSGR